MVGCDSCDAWVHFDCVKLRDDQVSRIINFYCLLCEQKPNGTLNTWKSDKPSNSELIDERKNYYEVDSIVNHDYVRFGKVVNRRRRFRVRWRGYDHKSDTWEPESNLDGCLDVLQKYSRDNNMPLANIRGLLGDDKKQIINKSNWCPMSTIIDKVLTYKSIFFKDVSLEIDTFTEFKDNDGLYFIDLGIHCFVLTLQ